MENRQISHIEEFQIIYVIFFPQEGGTSLAIP